MQHGLGESIKKFVHVKYRFIFPSVSFTHRCVCYHKDREDGLCFQIVLKTKFNSILCTRDDSDQINSVIPNKVTILPAKEKKVLIGNIDKIKVSQKDSKWKDDLFYNIQGVSGAIYIY